MRLWSIHPKYLDSKGLVAVWREGLLTQKVLKGETKGYRTHPQLERFRNHPHPRKAITRYLFEIWKKSEKRGYTFDRGKIEGRRTRKKVGVTRGQVEHEFALLKKRLRRRNPEKYREIRSTKQRATHPLFLKTEGGVERWEKSL